MKMSHLHHYSKYRQVLGGTFHMNEHAVTDNVRDFIASELMKEVSAGNVVELDV